MIHDTFDPSDTGCTIYPPHTRPEELPNSPALRKLDNGSWAYRPDRCVYGYWALKSVNHVTDAALGRR